MGFTTFEQGWWHNHDENRWEKNPSKCNNSKPMAYDTLLGVINSFIDWRNKQKTTKRGGKTMYDVKGHYQYLHENEMFDYWSKHVNCA